MLERFGIGRKKPAAQPMATALGLFSYGLGAAQLLRTGSVNRLMGIPDDVMNRTIQQGIGIRELISGTGLLFGDHKAAWLWFRAAGDVMDLGVLGAVLASGLSKRKHLIGSMAFIGSVFVADVVAAARASGGDD